MSYKNLLPLGNSKLGKMVHHWSLPANEIVCVMATALCASLCYAKKGRYRGKRVKDSYDENYQLSLEPKFGGLMVGLIRALFVRVVRIHASGEFYSIPYINKWTSIVRRSPNATFYCYTRCWQDKNMLPHLVELAGEPNFHMWWSCDKETGPPPYVKGVRSAYLKTGNNDDPWFEVDLYFRDAYRTKGVMKFGNDRTLVCPSENGVTKTTCSQCQLCFTDCVVPRSKEVFQLEEVC